MKLDENRDIRERSQHLMPRGIGGCTTQWTLWSLYRSFRCYSWNSFIFGRVRADRGQTHQLMHAGRQ